MVGQERRKESRGVEFVNPVLLSEPIEACCSRGEYTPEPSNKPLNGLDGGHKSQPAARQVQKCLYPLVQCRVLLGRQLGTVRILALVAEQSQPERRKSRIQLAKLLETLVTHRVDLSICLTSRNPGLEDQRLRMRRLQRSGVQATSGVGSDLRKLRRKRGSHSDCLPVTAQMSSNPGSVAPISTRLHGLEPVRGNVMIVTNKRLGFELAVQLKCSVTGCVRKAQPRFVVCCSGECFFFPVAKLHHELPRASRNYFSVAETLHR